MIPKPAETDIAELEKSLNEADHATRLSWMRDLGKKDMDALYEMAEGRDVPPEYFLDSEGGPLTFDGRNSLPAFSNFQKAFARHQERIQGWNVNGGIVRWFGGPGHFQVRKADNWEGQLIFDYVWECTSAPQNFPTPESNLKMPYRLVYGNMEDVVRRVSKDVIISKAYRKGKPEGAFFSLCRPV